MDKDVSAHKEILCNTKNKTEQITLERREGHRKNMSQNSWIWEEIRNLNEKINDCNSAISEIRTVRGDCASKKTDWQSSFNKLADNQELMNVKKTNVFEGQMANGLQSKVADAADQIRTGISKTGTLESSLDSQITKLEEKISDFEDEISRLKQQLD